MIKTIFISIFSFISIIASAQADKINYFNKDETQGPVEVSNKSKKNGRVLYVSNSAYCPVSVSLYLDMTNMAFSEGKQTLFIVPPRVEKVELGEVTIIDTTLKSKFSYGYDYSLGSVLLTEYDTAYQYELPYKKGLTFKIGKGHKGLSCHKYKTALDFIMPKGTEILAARDGIVVYVGDKDENIEFEDRCGQFDNSIYIYHDDGTIAQYSHIKYNSAKVKEGEHVAAGALIASCSNGENKKGSFFHFECLLPRIGYDDVYLPTKFKIENGTTTALLKEGAGYLKNY